MQQDATDIVLTVKQQQVLDLLLQGQSITSISQTINVDRSTIYRWQSNVEFEAERNKKARELRDASKSKLTNLAEKSLMVVDEALEKGDAKTALAVLKGVGYLSGVLPMIGSSVPEELTAQRERDEKQKAYDDLLANMLF